MSTNNAINNTVVNNDFDVNLSTAGSSSTSSVVHSDNTNTASHAELRMEVGGTSGGDPNIYFNIPSGSDYSLGIDNTVSDNLVITDSTTPSAGTNIFRLYSDGNRRLEKTPAVAFSQAETTSVTGDGTTYTLLGTTVYFDQGGDFSSPTFTAPVTGKYCITIGVGTLDWSTHTSQFGAIVTSNQTYNTIYYGNGNIQATDVQQTRGCVLADMDAGDTATMQITVSGGSKIIDVRTDNIIPGIYLAV